MQYSDWETPIEQLMVEDGQISERANTSPKPTSTYIARVRVSHENAKVPPGSVFEEGRKLYMGERYINVPESWEDRPTDSSTEATLSTRSSTQAGEDTAELSIVPLEVNQVHPPVSVTVDSPSPAKRPKSTAGPLRQTLLESFLLMLGHTPSPEKMFHPPPDISPPQTPLSKNQRSQTTVPTI